MHKVADFSGVNRSAGGLLAVDTVVLMKPMGIHQEQKWLNFTGNAQPVTEANATNVYVKPEDIEASLNGIGLETTNHTIVFNNRGPSVTTGVGGMNYEQLC